MKPLLVAIAAFAFASSLAQAEIYHCPSSSGNMTSQSYTHLLVSPYTYHDKASKV